MIRPIGERILVKPQELKQGKLILANQKHTQFLVIDIGEKVTNIKANDTVYIEKHYGSEIEYENEKYLVLDSSSVLAVLSPPMRYSPNALNQIGEWVRGTDKVCVDENQTY